jgi:hypothetical protein
MSTQVLCVEDDFSIDKYLPLLPGISPLSFVLDLSSDVAQALVAAFNEFFPLYFKHLRKYGAFDTSAAAISTNECRSPFLNSSISWMDVLEGPHKAALMSWAAELDASVSSFQGGCFVRLSTRSPKDSLALRRRQEKLDMHALAVTATKTARPPDMAVHPALCRTAQDAIELLVTSQRVHDDLVSALAARAASSGSPDDVYSMKLILREWVTCAEGAEFRVFVCNRRVRAISQYATHMAFPYLQDATARTAIMRTITSFVNDVCMPRLPDAYANAVVDVLISPSAASSTPPLVIELNPFLIKTGAALFHWRDDWAQLTAGEVVEVRTRTEGTSDIQVDKLTHT